MLNTNPSRLFAAMAGAHEAAELEVLSRGVLGRQADVRLDDRHLTLLDDEHGHLLDAHQERIEVVGAVEERVVLQADPPAALEERLEVLVRAVLAVLRSENRLDHRLVADDFAFGAGRVLEPPDVVESAEAAGDVTCR
jgi:cobyrinic acid a,c-diamide synthase